MPCVEKNVQEPHPALVGKVGVIYCIVVRRYLSGSEETHTVLVSCCHLSILVTSSWLALDEDTLTSSPSSLLELQTKVREDVGVSVVTTMEKAPTRAFSRLKVPTSAFTFTLLRHYAKQALTHAMVSRCKI